MWLETIALHAENQGIRQPALALFSGPGSRWCFEEEEFLDCPGMIGQMGSQSRGTLHPAEAIATHRKAQAQAA